MASATANSNVSVATSFSKSNPASQGFVVFDSEQEGFCPQEILLGCNPDGSGNLWVNVEGLHDPTDWAPIYKGGDRTFYYAAGIRKVVIATNGVNSCLVDWAVTRR